MQYPIYKPSEAESVQGLQRMDPDMVLDKESMRAAVAINKISIEQLIVFCPAYSALAAHPIYERLRQAVIDAGNGKYVNAAEAAAQEASLVQLDDETKKTLKRLLT